MILYIKNLKIKESEKIKLYNKLLKCTIDYDNYYNNYNIYWGYNKYSTIFCSYQLNVLSNKYILKKNISNSIIYPKINTVIPNKSLNNKYIPFNFF